MRWRVAGMFGIVLVHTDNTKLKHGTSARSRPNAHEGTRTVMISATRKTGMRACDIRALISVDAQAGRVSGGRLS